MTEIFTVFFIMFIAFIGFIHGFSSGTKFYELLQNKEKEDNQ